MQSEIKTEKSTQNQEKLRFGTGGIRGIMGEAENQINAFTLGKATQALAVFLHQKYPNQKISVGLTCDSRNNSVFLVEKMAEILTANHIYVFLTSEPRPTPLLAFWLREKKLQAGIIITASHNPKNYNGFKVYNDQGGQIIFPEDQEIIKISEHLEKKDILWEKKSEKYQFFNQNDEDVYINKVIQKSIFSKDSSEKKLKIAYSALFGTGGTVLPKLLKKANYSKIFTTQMELNGDFPELEAPNPEEKSAMKKLLELAENQNADLALATDPDADRVGVAVKNSENIWILLNGNQIAMILAYTLLENLKDQGLLKEKSYLCKSFVTTEALDDLAKYFNISCYTTPTGFKYIAQKMDQKADETFILGAEESFGYLWMDDLRDKDGVATAFLLCELANFYQKKSKTLLDLLTEIEEKIGCFAEKTLALTFSELKKAQDKMNFFKTENLTEIQGFKIQKKEEQADFLTFILEKNDKIKIRVSGTEPKLKIYLQVRGKNRLEAEKKIEILSEYIYFKTETL